MSSLNQVNLIGNVGQKPEVRKGGTSGMEFVTMSVATTERWNDRDGNRQERTEWHRVVVFNKGLVEIVRKYVSKGDKIYVSGKLQTRKWEQDGVERYSTEVVLQGFEAKVVLLGGSRNGGSGQSRPSGFDTGDSYASGAHPDEREGPNDTIPF